MQKKTVVSLSAKLMIMSCLMSLPAPLAFSEELKAVEAAPLAQVTESAPSTVTTVNATLPGDQSLNPSPTAVISPLKAPEKVLLKPGQPLTLDMAAEDLVPTDNVELARQQVLAYPDSAEASFILAVALSRTSKVETALQEVRRARRLAAAQGGPVYFDKMIASYEEMLKSYPQDNRVRYGLAWAYYMKAYLLAKNYPANPAIPAVSDNSPVPGPQAAKQNWVNAAAAGQVLGMLSPQLANKVPNTPGAVPMQQLPHMKGALELAAPAVVPQIKKYYEAALKNLDDLLARNPDDIWAKVYRAHLYAEFTGNLQDSMNVWLSCQKQSPQNPAPYFFLGQGYLKQGNLKECLNNISRAIALRAVGN